MVHSSDAPTLVGERVTLRPAGPDDVERLREILTEPSVARWWGGARPGEPDYDVAEDWLDVEPTDTTFVIELDGLVVGSIQCSEELEPDYRHAGIDLFLDTAHQGAGLGPDAIRTLARWLIEERGHHRLTIYPSAANERAIAAYRSVGFRPVGVMRRYERGPDGTWHDGLLMDLLAEELT
jgi:aminoglycoside 6'-N-acetyltransferase